LALAYSAARGLIYPSLYEGFGLPILEAMACGCPVIIGRHGSIPEVAGGAAIYCDMTDPKAIAQACLWLTDPVQGDHFAQLGRERAAQFSWSRMAAEVARQVERLAEPVQSAEVLVDKPAPQAKKKRALLSYLTAPLQLPKDYRGAFSNAGIVRSWVQVLEEMGYLVDVVDWDTTEFEPAQPYDLFVGHGGRNWSHITAQLPPDCIKVYFSTGSPWERHNWAEASRFDDLQLRRLVRLPGDRQITAEETTAYHEADGIIVLGNRAAATEFTDYPFVKAAHAVDCGVYPDDHFDPAKKDYGAGRNRFLFFSGIGNMHKGLDLLLEAFAGMLEAELFIATNVEPEFAKVYARELALPNVHVEGWVELKGRRFYELVDTCDWVVLPSCSEGQPGSVLECMNQGLVPIVTKACHLDIGEDGRLIEFPTPLSIRADIRTVMEWPEDAIARAASRVWEMARVRHSPEAFRKGLLSAVEEIRASRPIVSAIVSTYNSEKFLPGCLDDLEAQTLADRLEIIVVNSGSQQGERAIVEAYQARFQNIRYIETAERETVYAAWNRGAKEARGRYLTNANTDDRSHPERMERLARELDAHAELALVYANLWITTEENGAFETSPHIGAFRWHEFDREALHTGCFCGPQPMWRKSVHDKHGWFDPTFTSAGDWEFWLRMVSAGEIFKHVDEFLGLYLKREDSVEHQANKAGVARQEMLELQRRHAEKVVA
jgi:glycosyltransferase involved in cell wall biosynthesis